MVDFESINSVDDIEKLQLEGKITMEELKKALKILSIKEYTELSKETVGSDKGQKNRIMLAKKVLANLDFEEIPEEKKYDEEFAKFEKLH